MDFMFNPSQPGSILNRKSLKEQQMVYYPSKHHFHRIKIAFLIFSCVICTVVSSMILRDALRLINGDKQV